MSDTPQYRPEDLDPWGRPKPGAQPIGTPAIEEVPVVADTTPFGEAPVAPDVVVDENVVPPTDGSEPTPVTEVVEPAPLTDPEDKAWEEGAQAPAVAAQHADTATTGEPSAAVVDATATPPAVSTPTPAVAPTGQTSGSLGGHRVYSTGKVAKEPQNLERELNQVLVDYLSGAYKVPDGKHFTPHIISVEIGRRRGGNVPSAGAVTAALNRWSDLGYVVMSADKPKRFVSFGEAAKTKTLAELKADKRAARSAAKAAQKAASAPAPAPAPVEDATPVADPTSTTDDPMATSDDVQVPAVEDTTPVVGLPEGVVDPAAPTVDDLPDVTA